MKDYYAILGIKENADAQEIKKAYRKLVKIYHPDVVKEDKEKISRMSKLNCSIMKLLFKQLCKVKRLR